MNGQAIAVHFPMDVGRSSSKLDFITDTGTWNIERQQAAFKVDLTLSYIGEYLDIRVFKGRLILTLTLEDPDSGKVLVFERNN